MPLFVTLAVAMLLIAEIGIGAEETSDWSICVGKCRCKWVSGRRTAECTEADLTRIPDNLSPDIQHANLSRNTFISLPADAFKSVGLVNLQKLYLRECKIRNIDKDAFRGLKILIELDLSENNLLKLHPDTFSDNFRLRLLFLNRNPLQKLEDGLFTNLNSLQTVSLSECDLTHIGSKTFNNDSSLHQLYLDGNNMTHLKLSVVEKLVRLRSLVLHNNPWKCDCHLRAFRDWVIEKNLCAQPISCSEPLHLQNKFWADIDSQEFACKPKIIYPPVGTKVLASGDDVTLSCKVSGNPLPEVNWVFNSRIIMNNTRTKFGGLRYTILSSGETDLWVNITISRFRASDHGEFRCVARSPGGIDERNVSLIVDGAGLAQEDSETHFSSESWPLVIGLTTGLIALVIVIVVICCCICRKCHNDSLAPLHHHIKKTPGNGLSTNGEIITRHVSGVSDQGKSLLAVNPVQKPPRRYESQMSSTPGGGELSELNRNLLDDGSVIASGTGDDERSIESMEDTPLKSREKLDTEYPPDLIAFPGRTRQNASPVGSITSSALPTEGGSRYPLIGSPPPMLHSPICRQFGTLPYARAGSPFSVTGLGPASKQGYVTIPRRPRVPSWTGSGPPTACIIDHSVELGMPQPVYDNLGPRTTADGSSALSLNKSGSEVGTMPSKRGTQKPINVGLVRPFSPLSPPSLPCDELRSWGTTSGQLRRSGSVDGPLMHHSSTPAKTKVVPKIAPKPPPKPVKVATNQGPLYEDEGEDGTEV